MSLTLKSLRTEMRSSFAEMSLRIDNILLKLGTQSKETDSNFREVDQRFDKLAGDVDRRFDKLTRDVDKLAGDVDRKFDKLTSDIVTSFSPYFSNIEKMLSNHEDRIAILEKRH